MSKRKKFFLLFVFIIFDMVLLIGFLVIRDATMLNDLKKEVSSVAKLDITKDRYNTPIKSRGNYAIVEEAIKEYLDDYAVLLQETLSIIQDEKLTKVLSFDNYSSDGPEFVQSFEYLTSTKKKFDENMNLLLEKMEEEKMSNYINDKTENSYYRDLYRELMLDVNVKSDIQETKDLLYKTQIRVDNILDVSSEVLKFLVTTKDSWKLEEGQIQFLTEDLYNQYNALVSKLSS